VTGDARVVRRLRNVIQLGVAASMALILGGMLVCFLHHPSYLFSADEMAVLKDPGGAKVNEGRILLAALGLRGQAVVLSGLMILMVTPIAAVLVALVSFVGNRKWAFTVISATVLLLLLLSAVLGRAS
jgi:uncharacterized membrane protein